MSWSQIKEQMEDLEKDLEAMDRVGEVLERWKITPGIQFESIKKQVVRDLEAAKERACWFAIRSEIDDLSKRLTKAHTPDCFTVKTPTMSALIGYIRHLETKAGVTNDKP